MRNKNQSWRYLRALLIGVLLTTTFALLIPTLSSYVVPSSQGKRVFRPRSIPNYLDNAAAGFHNATRHKIDGIGCNGLGGRYPYLEFLGDITYYQYGNSTEPWNPKIHGNLPPQFVIERQRFGWPFRAVSSDDVMLSGDSANGVRIATFKEIDNFIDIVHDRMGLNYGIKEPSWFPCRQGAQYFPIMPIWTGLVLDTLFWGVLSLAPSTIWQATIRKIRRRRGLCTSCGYKIDGLTACPECGHSNGDQAAA
jgi:hypothetical protein